MRRIALFALLLTGACASADKERESFLDGDRPHSASSKADTGSCKPWFVSPMHDWGEGAPKHSCWNLVWEVPTAIITVPIALAIVTSPVWVPIVLLH